MFTPAKKLITMGGSKIIVSDSFNRANNASSLGNADTGQAWVQASGTWGIHNNQAYISGDSGAFNRAYIDSGISDFQLSITVATVSNARIIFRFIDESNELSIVTASKWDVYKRVNGTPFIILSHSVTPANGDKIKITCIGNLIKVAINGVEMSVTESANVLGTKHGMCSHSSNTPKFDDFKVEAI